MKKSFLNVFKFPLFSRPNCIFCGRFSFVISCCSLYPFFQYSLDLWGQPRDIDYTDGWRNGPFLYSHTRTHALTHALSLSLSSTRRNGPFLYTHIKTRRVWIQDCRDRWRIMLNAIIYYNRGGLSAALRNTIF